jgi:hypothetical protein
MDWTNLELKKEPSSYPTIAIYNDQGEDSDFDYETFMQSFQVASKPAIFIPKLRKLPITTYTVIKMDMIVISAVKARMKQITTCESIVPPTSDTLYFTNNRRMFLTQVLSLVKDYKQVKEVTCDSLALKFELLPHQRLARSYINASTPYRGLLLYHGLGSGKTCTAIAISENLKAFKQVVVMTPKSLEMNFLQELKKCGDTMYSLQQKWTWTTDPSPVQLHERCLTMSDLFKKDLSKGIWINSDEPSNFDILSESDQETIKRQIDSMIRKKYEFVIYNGNGKTIQGYAAASKNQFSNKLIIIDEAHNFVTRIVNKLSVPDSLSCKLYRKIMEAENCKIVMLTGTPMINQAHEVAVLFNMLRGYMYTWTCKTDITEEAMRANFPDMDTFKSTHGSITFTQLPAGFIRPTPTSVAVYQQNYDSSTFSTRVTDFFKGTTVNKNFYTALPDDQTVFNEKFIDSTDSHKLVLFQHRIAGLASHFPDLANLMPVLNKTEFVKIEMSPFQYNEYIGIRMEEREREKKSSKKSLKKGEESSSTYRINSRLICNTTYPISAREYRPKNKETEVLSKEEDEEEEEEEKVKSRETFFKAIDNSDYCDQIKLYSPKYDAILNKINRIEATNPNQLHLLYSQFLNIEGIKLFSKVLDANGYTEFKLKRTKMWKLDVIDTSKKMYMIYGGSKISVEQKELFRNIFNKNWEAVPTELRDEVKDLKIPLFMITSAGAEGISLKQVQNVHIMEPYWNPIRIDQVIGRARRICSHTALPKMEQYVNVFMYIMTLPSSINIEDVMDDDVNGVPGTTDEYLQWKSMKKREVAEIITRCIKNASIDYSLKNEFVKPAPHSDEILLYEPDIDLDADAKSIKLNVKQSMGKIKYKGEPTLKVGTIEDADHFVELFTMDDVLCGYAKLQGPRVPPELYTLNRVKASIPQILANVV